VALPLAVNPDTIAPQAGSRGILDTIEISLSDQRNGKNDSA
jgi:hypothetical protein